MFNHRELINKSANGGGVVSLPPQLFKDLYGYCPEHMKQHSCDILKSFFSFSFCVKEFELEKFSLKKLIFG